MIRFVAPAALLGAIAACIALAWPTGDPTRADDSRPPSPGSDFLPASIQATGASGGAGFYLEISPDNLEDIESLFATLESTRGTSPGGDEATGEPVVVILHGEEAFSFLPRSESSNPSLIDRAATLEASRLIEVRMCQTWMDANGVRASDLPPFMEPVPYAPEEIKRLEALGFMPYDSVEI